MFMVFVLCCLCSSFTIVPSGKKSDSQYCLFKMIVPVSHIIQDGNKELAKGRSMRPSYTLKCVLLRVLHILELIQG